MEDRAESDVTLLLNRIGQGDRRATEKLFTLVYDELRAIAQIRMAAERPDHTLSATALVHEAYLRLNGAPDLNWKNRGHFFAAAAEAMRRILIDRARARGSEKRSPGGQRVELTDIFTDTHAAHETLLALDEALGILTREDPKKAQIVKLHFFAGLTLEQAADALDIARATACRYWNYARARLYLLLSGGDDNNFLSKNS